MEYSKEFLDSITWPTHVMFEAITGNNKLYKRIKRYKKLSPNKLRYLVQTKFDSRLCSNFNNDDYNSIFIIVENCIYHADIEWDKLCDFFATQKTKEQ